MIKTRIALGIFFSLLIFGVAAAQEGDRGLFSVNPEIQTGLFFGVEYSELMQNHFSNLGSDNFTFDTGQQFGKFRGGYWGWRFLAIHVELGEAHLQNEDQVKFIEGDRTGLSGDVTALRLYGDYYPVIIGLGFAPRLGRTILRIEPCFSLGMGYNSWGFYEASTEEEYRLNALTGSFSFRLHSEILEFLYVDNPLFDFFLYLWKSRSPQGELGAVTITRPDVWGLFSWATIGVRLAL